MFENRELLKKIFAGCTDAEKSQYIVFSHSDKIWVMPSNSLRMSFDMYQPSTIKGNILKSLIVRFKKSKTALEKLKCEKLELSCSDVLRLYFEKILGTTNLKIAVYMGDDSSRQNNKATLQVNDGTKVLCFAKITDDEEVAKNFQKEINSLKFLQGRNVLNIPRVLEYGEIDGLKVFVQSSNKLPRERVKLQFRRKQVDFIKNIVEKTSQKFIYQETDFCQSVRYLKENLDDFSDEHQKVIHMAVSTIEKELYGKEDNYAFSHGDYTPWNVYYLNGEMYAFDFEYCSKTMPVYIDVFHYLTQLSVLGKHNGVGKTVHLYKKYRKMLEEYISCPDLIYMCYLIHIIGFYHHRTQNKLVLVQDKMELWIGMLDYLNTRIQKEKLFIRDE